MKFVQGVGDLDRRSERIATILSGLLSGPIAVANGNSLKRQGNQEDPAVAQCRVPSAPESPANRQLPVDRRRLAISFVRFSPVDESRLCRHFDEGVRPAPRVTSDIQLVPHVVLGRMAAPFWPPRDAGCSGEPFEGRATASRCRVGRSQAWVKPGSGIRAPGTGAGHRAPGTRYSTRAIRSLAAVKTPRRPPCLRASVARRTLLVIQLS